jgi:hypothetical protein
VDLTVTDGSASAPAQWRLTIIRARRADLAAAVSVAPNPSLIGNPATWTLSIQNGADVDVGNAALHGTFTGNVPLTFAAPSNAACSVTPSANQTELDCNLGPLPANGRVEVTVASTASQAGAAHALVTASIVDPLPVDGNAANDQASVTLDLAERLSGGPAQRLTVTDARGAAPGDLNGDGFLDLAVATVGGPVIFRNVVDPVNASRRILADTAEPLAGDASNSQSVAVADLDADGDSDVVVGNAAGQPNKVLVNDGSGTFTALALTEADAATRAVALGDIDGDGLPDIVFANNGQSGVHVNRASAGITRTQTVGGGDSRDAVLANLFGDALPEIVLANGDGDAAVYRNTAGQFAPALTLPTGPTTSVAAADFDGDGDIDLVFGKDAPAGTATPPANVVFLNTSAGAPAFFKSAELVGSATIDVLASDFDMDDDTDILSVGQSGGHRIYVNDGAAHFLLHAEQFVHAGASAGAAGNFSVDDRVDVAVPGSTAIGVFFNDGRGNLGSGDSAAPIVSLSGEPTISIVVGQSYQDAGATAVDDVDGDLTASIVVSNPVDTAVLGTYSVAYNVTDSSGNAAPTVTRVVEVRPQTGTGGGGGGALGAELALLLATLALRARRPRAQME